MLGDGCGGLTGERYAETRALGSPMRIAALPGPKAVRMPGNKVTVRVANSTILVHAAMILATDRTSVSWWV